MNLAVEREVCSSNFKVLLNGNNRLCVGDIGGGTFGETSLLFEQAVVFNI